MSVAARKALRSVYGLLIRTPLGEQLLHRYDYMYEPAQLLRLTTLLKEALAAEGNIVEVGCAHGRTTVFLNRYLDDVAPSRDYFAIDTFAGFVTDDIAEERRRGRRFRYDQYFKVNSVDIFRRTMALNAVQRVTPIQTDVNEFRFADLAPISFCLIDVDLHRPVLHALNDAWRHVPAGGIIVVDDCDGSTKKWRGGYEAYMDFVRERDLPIVIEERKLGIIRKPA